MNAGIRFISEHEYATLLQKLDSMEEKLLKLTSEQNPLTEKWLDNEEAARLLKVGYRSLQNYRDKGILPFTILGGKVFYKASDIEQVLVNNYQKKVN